MSADPPPSTSLFRKIVHTFAVLMFNQGSSIAAGIATARVYGPQGRGVLSLATILLGFAFTAAEGLRQSVAYQIGREKLERHAVWHTALRVIAVSGLVGTAILLVLWRVSPNGMAYLYVALAFPFALYAQAAGMLYVLGDRVEKINVQNAVAIGGGFSLVTLVLAAVFAAPLWIVLSSWVAAYALAAVWAASGIPALLGPNPRVAQPPGILREQLLFASKSALSSTITLLALRVDVLIITALLSPAVLGIYTLALAAGEITWNVSRAVLWSAAGRIATLDFEESAALCARLVRTLVAFQFCSGVFMFAFGPWLIDHVYGTRFHESGSVLRLLLPGAVFYSADGVLSNFISVRAARPGLLLVLECVTLILTAGIIFLGISRLGVYAGALAHTVSYIIAYVVKVAVFLRLTRIPVVDIVLPRPSDLPYALRLRFAASKA